MRQTGLVVGAGGAIGYSMLDLLCGAADKPRMFATHPRPVSSNDADLTWLQLDLSDDASISWCLRKLCDATDTLDFVVFATGVLHGPDLKPEKKMGDWSMSQFERTMKINAGGPLTLLTGLSTLLQKSVSPRVMFLSAQIGSIADNGSGGWYSYRMSKAALNMGVRTASMEAQRWRNDASILAVHPGTTSSGLSRPYTRRRQDLLRPRETANALVQLLAAQTGVHNGLFVDRFGQPLPW